MKTLPKQILRIFFVVIILAALVFGAARLVKKKKTALAAASNYQVSPLAVQTATASAGTWELVRNYLAVVEPVQTATLTARLVATVESVYAEEGDTVQAGQLLIKLDDREIKDAISSVQSQIEQVQAERNANEATVKSLVASLDYWEREAQRNTQLQASGVITVSEAEATSEKVNEVSGRLDSARQKSNALEHQATSLKRRLAEVQTRLSYCYITSPFEAVVSARHVDPGEMAVSGRMLLTIEDQSQLKLAFDVPQHDLPLVHTGMLLRYDLPNKPIGQASLSILYPSLNKARMMRAEAMLSDEQVEGVVSGAYIPLSMTLARQEDITFVPGTAVVESPEGDTYVFTVVESRLQAMPVNVVGHQGAQTAIEGVEPGEQVVLSTFLGWSSLGAGLPVEVRQ